MDPDEKRKYDREWRRKYRASHPPSEEQLASLAARARQGRIDHPGHQAALTAARRADNPEPFREMDRRRWADPKRRAVKQAYARSHRDSWRSTRFRQRYGITVAEYEAMHRAQGGVCAICKRPEEATGTSGHVKHLAVDHHHGTGVVRGLLCQRCNSALGSMRDDPMIVKAALEFLLLAGGGM